MRNISKNAARGFATSVAALMLGSLISPSSVFAQATGAGTAPAAKTAAAERTGVDVSPAYLIGPEDVLSINFWREAEMTGDVTVRPDGRVTLPLVGEIHAAGLTPDALRQRITEAANKLLEDPSVTVTVRQINSRKVYITGNVATPGAHPLTGERTVLQVIALAGGLTEFADRKNISVVRVESGKQRVFKLNYNDVSKGKNLEQNIILQPGDTIIVP